MRPATLKRICAWCGRDMGVTVCTMPAGTYPKDAVTHGICEECHQKVLAEIRKEQKECRDTT